MTTLGAVANVVIKVLFHSVKGLNLSCFVSHSFRNAAGNLA